MNEATIKLFKFKVGEKDLFHTCEDKMAKHIQKFIDQSLMSNDDEEIEDIKKAITYDYHVNDIKNVSEEKFIDFIEDHQFYFRNHSIYSQLSDIEKHIKNVIIQSRRNNKINTILNDQQNI